MSGSSRVVVVDGKQQQLHQHIGAGTNPSTATGAAVQQASTQALKGHHLLRSATHRRRLEATSAVSTMTNVDHHQQPASTGVMENGRGGGGRRKRPTGIVNRVVGAHSATSG